MSRWTLEATDMVATVGMDFTIQFWLTDHRGESIPVDRPARLTAKDHLGQVLFDADSVDDADDPASTVDPLTNPWLAISQTNGMVQLVVPRAVTATWTPGKYSYDLWASLPPGGVGGAFPAGQQLPIVRGSLNVTTRVTIMEAL